MKLTILTFQNLSSEHSPDVEVSTTRGILRAVAANVEGRSNDEISDATKNKIIKLILREPSEKERLFLIKEYSKYDGLKFELSVANDYSFFDKIGKNNKPIEMGPVSAVEDHKERAFTYE